VPGRCAFAYASAAVISVESPPPKPPPKARGRDPFPPPRPGCGTNAGPPPGGPARKPPPGGGPNRRAPPKPGPPNPRLRFEVRPETKSGPAPGKTPFTGAVTVVDDQAAGAASRASSAVPSAARVTSR